MKSDDSMEIPAVLRLSSIHDVLFMRNIGNRWQNLNYLIFALEVFVQLKH